MALILIVDDDGFGVREPLSAQLTSAGHKVHLAENGRQAVTMVLDTEYDLIVTDIRMPGMDGLEFIQQVIKIIEGVTPVIVLTGYHDVTHAIRAIQVGAYDYIRKPWELAEMTVAVNRALTRRLDMKFRRDYQIDLERRVQSAVSELKAAFDGTVIGFTTLLEGKDSTTADHCYRVRDACSLIGREMGLGTDRIRDLELGAMLHDIGKYKIPDEILKKPAKLTPEEWDVMRQHPAFGAEVCEKISFLNGARDVVYNHHEKWDGSGYPRGLKGDAIPLNARIFMLVDAYDTITSKRSYKLAETPEHALEEIRRCSGAHFDPEVVRCFEKVYPVLSEMTRLSMATRRDTVTPKLATAAR